mgnify:CR=1 FL=1
MLRPLFCIQGKYLQIDGNEYITLGSTYYLHVCLVRLFPHLINGTNIHHRYFPVNIIRKLINLDNNSSLTPRRKTANTVKINLI